MWSKLLLNFQMFIKSGIGQYLKIFFLNKFHLSCKNLLLIYKYKKKNSQNFF